MTKVFVLENLGCANCADKMERKISKIKGVEAVSVNFMSKKLSIDAQEVLFDEIIESAKKIVKKIERDVELKPL